MKSFTECGEFIKESESLAPDGDGDRVGGHPEGDLRPEGEQPLTELGLVRRCVVYEASHVLNKLWRRRIDIELFENAFHFVKFSLFQFGALLHWVDGDADDAVGVAHRVTVHGAVAGLRRGDVR